jgi:hypothetical protein
MQLQVKKRKQDKDASLNEAKTPGLSGDGSGKVDESMSWDMTKTQESVDQVLEVIPKHDDERGTRPQYLIGNKLYTTTLLTIRKRPRSPR